MRGKWLANKQVRERRPGRVHSRDHELTSDHPANRLIKAALIHLHPRVQGAKLYRRIQELLPLFHCVGDLSDPNPILPPVNRQTQVWQPLWEMARWFVAGSSPEPHGGKAGFHSMLFDMGILYEHFLRAELKAVLVDLGLALIKPTGSKWVAECIDQPSERFGELKPDYQIFERANLVGLLDAKWKDPEQVHSGSKSKASGNGPFRLKRDDMYQMYAYADHFGIQELGVLFPVEPGCGGILSQWRLPAAKARLTLIGVDLSHLKQGRTSFQAHLKALVETWRSDVAAS